jgi:L-fuculose-phosphate aldolase
MKEKDLRQAIVDCCRKLQSLGVNQGSAGNVSTRIGDVFLITPSGVPYDVLTSDMLATMPVHGEYGAWRGKLKPSSEWRIHLDIYRAQPNVGAIVHAHPPFATAFSMLRKPLPATHYMIAALGGPQVRCAPYATYGTKELSDGAVAGLDGRHAVLLANHGAIACGGDIDEALWRMTELEQLARMTQLALSMGKPVILPDDEIARVAERFKTYGYKNVPLVAARRPAAQRKAILSSQAQDEAKKAVKAKPSKSKAAKAKSTKAKAPKAKLNTAPLDEPSVVARPADAAPAPRFEPARGKGSQKKRR